MRDRLPLFAVVGASAVSLLGNTLAAVAVPWLVLETTGSPAKTGLAAFAAAVAVIGGGFFGGTLVDRLGARRASVLGDVLSGLTIAGIPIRP